MNRGYAAFAVAGIAAAVVVLTLNSAPFQTMSMIQNSGESAFIEYLAKFGKSYADLSEYEMRKAIFEETLKNVTEHNAQDNHTWQMGLNQFSDMPPHEISKYKGALIDDKQIENLTVPPMEIKERRINYYPIDYRSYMNPVVDQGGAC